MLTRVAHRRLLAIIAESTTLLTLVEAGVATTEVELRVAAIKGKLEELEAAIGPAPSCDLARHLGWLLRGHRNNKPESYATDIEDIRNVDLPALLSHVSKWEERTIAPDLVQAVSTAWDRGDYLGAVRSAFVHLEVVLRHVGNVDVSSGMSGVKLVDHVLKDKGVPITGAVTRGEQTGAYHFVKGCFMLYRNAVAHRSVKLSPERAEELIGMVNVCLRLVQPAS